MLITRNSGFPRVASNDAATDVNISLYHSFLITIGMFRGG
jgi:hypothetical protein